MFFGGPNRLVCSVLHEMREHLKTLNMFTLHRYKAVQAGLIEEAQTMVNRMESALEDWDDLNRAHKEVKKLKKQIKTLEKKKDTLE